MNGDPRSEYEQIRWHNYQNRRDLGWAQVRHRELKTLHIYHVRCRKLSPYIEGQIAQVCTACNMHLMEEPVPPPAKPRPDPMANFDSQGNPVRLDASGFGYYDSSRGHCGLCGSLTCRGCFK
jgi:hypothetical protein